MIAEIAHLGLLDDEDIQLDIAALELSGLDHDGLDLSPYVDQLEALEEELHEIGGAAETATEQAAALAELFASRHGFAGDRTSYDAPLNADMVRVLERRQGLPVSLSILYVALARRMGWSADALNTPGHVLVRLGPGEASIVIDPFNGGRVVSRDTLIQLVRQSVADDGSFDRSRISPMSNRMTLVRLLLNQATRAEQDGDDARAMSIYSRIVEVAPSHGQGWWDLARLQLSAGEVDEARGSLSSMLEITRDPESRAQVVAALEALSGQ